MTSLVEQKNQWLTHQVDVEYPTPESLAGRELYFTALAERQVNEHLCSELPSVVEGLDVYLVDFHRLTIMFALQQAKRWSSEADQALIVEYLTQIILSPEHQLFVGFENGEPVGAGMVSSSEQGTLVSDIIYHQQSDLNGVLPFVATVVNQHQALFASSSTIFIES